MFYNLVYFYILVIIITLLFNISICIHFITYHIINDIYNIYDEIIG